MYHFFVEPMQIGPTHICVSGTDVNHIKNVLRMKPGEELAVSDGCGSTYTCAIEELDAEQVNLRIIHVEEASTELKASITLFQGLPKGDKMEWIIQKCVELGVNRIVPVNTRRSIVKLDDKKADAKVRRWNTIAEGAAKQSGRAIVPDVASVMNYSQALELAKNMDVVMIPYEHAMDMEHTRNVLRSVQAGQSVGIFIGPEGGFEEAEVEQAMAAGASSVTLGRRILRTETAGMAVLAMLVFLLEE